MYVWVSVRHASKGWCSDAMWWWCACRRDDRLAMRRALLANEARRPSLDGTMLRRQGNFQPDGVGMV